MVDFEELADGFEFGSKDDSGYTSISAARATAATGPR